MIYKSIKVFESRTQWSIKFLIKRDLITDHWNIVVHWDIFFLKFQIKVLVGRSIIILIFTSSNDKSVHVRGRHVISAVWWPGYSLLFIFLLRWWRWLILVSWIVIVIDRYIPAKFVVLTDHALLSFRTLHFLSLYLTIQWRVINLLLYCPPTVMLINLVNDLARLCGY